MAWSEQRRRVRSGVNRTPTSGLDVSSARCGLAAEQAWPGELGAAGPNMLVGTAVPPKSCLRGSCPLGSCPRGRVRVVVPARVLLVQSILSVSPFCRRGLVLFYLAGHAGMPRGVVVSLWITLRRPKRVLFSSHVRSGAWLAPARRADDSDKSLLSKSGSVASADLGHLSPLYGRKVTKIAAKCLVAADRALSEAEVEAAATGVACLNQS